ncbi:hypothetical protein D3C80_2226190 [compost metagenome]
MSKTGRLGAAATGASVLSEHAINVQAKRVAVKIAFFILVLILICVLFDLIKN